MTEIQLRLEPANGGTKVTFEHRNWGHLVTDTAELALPRDDYLIGVGCGGGALLKAALQSGCRAAAVDHSG